MNAYSKYWILAGVLIAAVAYAVHSGLIGWFLVKYPDLHVQLMCLAIIVIFLRTYLVDGHRSARMLYMNEKALSDNLHSGIPLPASRRTVVDLVLCETIDLHQEGKEAGQVSFDSLVDMQRDVFEHDLTAGLNLVEMLRNFLFLIMLAFAISGVVMGFSQLLSPTNPEEAKVFTSTIIHALGIAYVPALECIVGFGVLYVLSCILQIHSESLIRDCAKPIYRAAHFGYLVKKETAHAETK